MLCRLEQFKRWEWPAFIERRPNLHPMGRCMHRLHAIDWLRVHVPHSRDHGRGPALLHERDRLLINHGKTRMENHRHNENAKSRGSTQTSGKRRTNERILCHVHGPVNCLPTGMQTIKTHMHRNASKQNKINNKRNPEPWSRQNMQNKLATNKPQCKINPHPITTNHPYPTLP